MARLAALLVAALGLGACAGPATLEPRDGYAVDHRQAATAHSSRIRHLVLHYTDADEAESLAALTGPRVSAHYLLPLPSRRARGRPLVYQLVEESRRAWHAGAGAWAGQTNINGTSIGIEIVNAGPDRSYATVERLLATHPERQAEIRWAPYPEAQIEALIPLARDIIARHDIAPRDVVGHADIAPSRKIDPGPAFPWRRLHEAGIGAWPDADAVARHATRFATAPPPLETLQRGLAAWGYALEASGEYDDRTRDVLRAFQMHFRPADHRGRPDAESAAILWALLEKYRPEVLARLEPPALSR